MPNQEADNYNILKKIIELVKTKLNSQVGIINICLDVIMLIAFLLLCSKSLLEVVIQLLLVLLNFVLTLLGLPSMHMGGTESSAFENLLCLIMIFAFTVICLVWVSYSEQGKEKLDDWDDK